jgi:biotin-dependent carboxylase-like uncharacterized protein
VSINVVHPGLSTSVQDNGRFGYYHLGIPPSGALDQYSFKIANLLVGNTEDAAVLECTFMGPRLKFTEDSAIAITGAEMPPRINDENVPMWRSIEVGKGDVLSFGHLKRGARTYIAVAGGVDVPEVLGSRSTYLLGAIGGHEGRTLRSGDVLPVGSNGKAFVERELPDDLRPALSAEVSVRVMMGLYDHLLTMEGSSAFLDSTWKVSPEADRIGYRYKADGVKLEFKERGQPFGAGSDPSNIVDAGYPIGSIQVPGGVEPIILLRDAVSGGGYAMVCTVISSDMDIVAQTQPNYRTSFEPVDLEQALSARRDYKMRLDNARNRLAEV